MHLSFLMCHLNVFEFVDVCLCILCFSNNPYSARTVNHLIIAVALCPYALL